MIRVLCFVLLLTLPALACDGMGAVLSFFLSGGPAIPVIAGFVARKLSKNMPTQTGVFAVLLSIPGAIIGFRITFDHLMSLSGFLLDFSLFFGPIVLICSTVLACLPAVLLRLSPYAPSTQDDRAGFLVKAIPFVFILTCAAILTLYALRFGAEPETQPPAPLAFKWNHKDLRGDSQATIRGVGLGMTYQEVVSKVGPPTLVWFNSAPAKRSRTLNLEELKRLDETGAKALLNMDTVRFGQDHDPPESAPPDPVVEVTFDEDGRVNRVWGDYLEYNGELVGQSDMGFQNIPRLKAKLPSCDEIRVTRFGKEYYYRSLGLEVDVRISVDFVGFTLFGKPNRRASASSKDM